MIIKQIHLEVEQLLQEQGIFSQRDFNHDEIDTAFNFVTNELVTALLSDNKAVTDGNFAEINQYYTDVIKCLKRRYEALGRKEDNKYYFALPSDYFSLISDNSYVYRLCDGKKVSIIKPNNQYKVIDKSVKYENVWYKKDEIFVGNTNTTLYPANVEVLELKINFVSNRLKRSEDIAWLLNDSIHKPNYQSPLSEVLDNNLIVYTDDFGISKLQITYYKVPTIVNYTNQITSDFPNNVCYYLIRKTFEHLKSSLN